MSENEIISKENYEDKESSHQKIIFDNTLFEQIKGKELDLSVEKILDIPINRRNGRLKLSLNHFPCGIDPNLTIGFFT